MGVMGTACWERQGIWYCAACLQRTSRGVVPEGRNREALLGTITVCTQRSTEYRTAPGVNHHI
jgi:hypothetical protein